MARRRDTKSHPGEGSSNQCRHLSQAQGSGFTSPYLLGVADEDDLPIPRCHCSRREGKSSLREFFGHLYNSGIRVDRSGGGSSSEFERKFARFIGTIDGDDGTTPRQTVR